MDYLGGQRVCCPPPPLKLLGGGALAPPPSSYAYVLYTIHKKTIYSTDAIIQVLLTIEQNTATINSEKNVVGLSDRNQAYLKKKKALQRIGIPTRTFRLIAFVGGRDMDSGTESLAEGTTEKIANPLGLKPHDAAFYLMDLGYRCQFVSKFKT